MDPQDCENMLARMNRFAHILRTIEAKPGPASGEDLETVKAIRESADQMMREIQAEKDARALIARVK